MTDRLYEFPDDDAPLSAWLKPVSALMLNRRQATEASTVDPSEARNNGGGSLHITRRMAKRMRDARRQANRSGKK